MVKSVKEMYIVYTIGKNVNANMEISAGNKYGIALAPSFLVLITLSTTNPPKYFLKKGDFSPYYILLQTIFVEQYLVLFVQL